MSSLTHVSAVGSPILTGLVSLGRTPPALVEQNSLALTVADHGYVLSGGRLRHDGPAQELFGDERLRRAYLGG